MKIKRFIGKKVRGYLNFDITFNDGLNFLIGMNGSGKTTVLRLLKGLLMESEDVLNEVYYKTICVEFDVKDIKFTRFSTSEHKITTSNHGKNIGYQSILFLELDRFDKFSTDALLEVRRKIYDFVRIYAAKKKDMEEEFKKSVLSLSQSGDDNLAEKLQQLDSAYTDKIDELKNKITRFVNAANLFFSEGDKVLTVNDLGEIIIKIDGKKEPSTIFDLSSGEKQLIIMLGYIVFDNATVIVIDEPELSLHLSWQYKFADALQTANPDAQFILATHAAGIIAKKSNEQYCIDLTPKKND